MKLSIGMLVSNRIGTVRKCLESVKPLLDKGIAELICLDTVSVTPGLVSDGSAELAKKYATKLVEFPWANDFSKARNITLENAVGEWYIYVDDDEWFDNVDEIIQFFETDEYKRYNSASYVTRDYMNVDGTDWTCSRVIRMTRRTESLRFAGKIHEIFNECYYPCKDFSVFTHHYGYAYKSDEDKFRHSERNMKLLSEEIMDRPNDLRLKAQVALEYINTDSKKAYIYINDVLSKFANQEMNPHFQWILSQLYVVSDALGFGPEKMFELNKMLHKQYYISEFAELAICYNMASVLLVAGEAKKALPFMEGYLELYNYIVKKESIRQSQNIADFERYISDSSFAEINEWLDYSKTIN